MAFTRRRWRITNELNDAGELISTEIIYYDKPADDADNPDIDMPEVQRHLTIDHTDSTPREAPEPRGKRTAGDLTAAQRTGIKTGITAALNALERCHPLNPGAG